jgi:hypothetical protein
VVKQITEIKTNQTVNWISKSRVLEDDPTRPQPSQAKEPEQKEEKAKK